MRNNSEKLSPKIYSTVRLLRYIAFVCMIIIFFMPIIRIQTVDEKIGMKATAGISPFQLLMGDTVTEAKVEFIDGDKESNEMLNSLMGSEAREVDVLHQLIKFIDDDATIEIMVKMLRIFGVVFGVIAGVASIGAASMASKRLTLQPTNENEVLIYNNIYISRVFAGLPKLFEVIENIIFMNILLPMIFLGMFNISALIMNEGNVEWQINIWVSVLVIVVAGLLKNASITKIIFTQERNKIQLYSARYNAPYTPTLSSDLSAISSIFGVWKPSENTEESELYKYKKLLDDGIITQEEYDQKKKELLNL